jgi:hypothetical protein
MRGGNEVDFVINPKTGDEIKSRKAKSNSKKRHDEKSPSSKMRLQASRNRIEDIRAETTENRKRSLESIDKTLNRCDLNDERNLEMDISDPLQALYDNKKGDEMIIKKKRFDETGSSCPSSNIKSVSKINNQAPSYPSTSSNDARDIPTNNPRVVTRLVFTKR